MLRCSSILYQSFRKSYWTDSALGVLNKGRTVFPFVKGEYRTAYSTDCKVFGLGIETWPLGYRNANTHNAGNIYRKCFMFSACAKSFSSQKSIPFKRPGGTKITDLKCSLGLKDPERKDSKLPRFCGSEMEDILSPAAVKADGSPCPPGDGDSDRFNRLAKIIGGSLLLLAAALGARYLFGGRASKKEKSPGVSPLKSGKPIKKIPALSSEIPTEVPYLLIGGGTAAFAAFTAIKSADPDAKVLVVSNESNYPYMRPPLSKELWYGGETHAEDLKFTESDGVEKSIYFHQPEFYTEVGSLDKSASGGVAVARGWTVKKLDVSEKKAYLEDDHAISYDKCLIATGATPRILNVLRNLPENIQDKIMTYRDIYDFEQVHEEVERGAKSIVIVGGSFLGSELACSLAQHVDENKFEVHQIFRESGNIGNILPEYLSMWTSDRVREKGVKVYNNAEVKNVELEGDSVVLTLSTGDKVRGNKIIVALGVEPNTELAELSGLETDKERGGFLVNAELMARTDLWVAGDCSCFYDPKLGRRRVEHHDHAMVSGTLAGENMTGSSKEYGHQSKFWSDLAPDIHFEAIGIVDSFLPTVAVFAKDSDGNSAKPIVTATTGKDSSKAEGNTAAPSNVLPGANKCQEKYGKGVVFYLRNDVVVGIVLWNIYNRIDVAREVIQAGRKYDDLNELAKLFNIHE